MTHAAVAKARKLGPVFAARARKWDVERTYCWDNIADLVDAGIMGMTIPEELGGLGASYLNVTEVIEEIAKVCTLTARVVVEANMGGISAVMEQRRRKPFAPPSFWRVTNPQFASPNPMQEALRLKCKQRRRGAVVPM